MATPNTPTVATVAKGGTVSGHGIVAAGKALLAKAVALAIGPNCTNVASAAMAVAQGNVATVASLGTTWYYVALHGAPTTGANPASWPPCYTANGGTVARKPGAPQGASGLPYATHAVAVPSNGPAVWGMVHVACGTTGSNAKASNPGNGTMVAIPAPLGATCGGVPCSATKAIAAALGLV